MLDTSEDLAVCEAEIGYPAEQLFTPLTRFSNRNPAAHFAIDNGCFKGFREAEFKALLKRERPNRDMCRFVCCPDVVENALRTMEIFENWSQNLHGWPIALVMQDGVEDMRIPWGKIAAIFIGGSNRFKLGPYIHDLVRTAHILGKWVHVGRINTECRLDMFEAMEVDSFDGSGAARYSWMRDKLNKENRAPLFNGVIHDAPADHASGSDGSLAQPAPQ